MVFAKKNQIEIKRTTERYTLIVSTISYFCEDEDKYFESLTFDISKKPVNFVYLKNFCDLFFVFLFKVLGLQNHMDGFKLPFFLSGASLSKEKQTDIVIGVVVGAVLILLIAFIIILIYKRHLKEKYAKYLEPNDNFTVCSVDILYYFYYCIMH